MKFVNLTKHVINLDGDAIPPSGRKAKVVFSEVDVGKIGHMPAITRNPLHVENLPEPEEGVTYIVPSMVLDHVYNRRDVIAPDTGETAVRNDRGHIMHVTRVVVA